jgi:hypothetical protein
MIKNWKPAPAWPRDDKLLTLGNDKDGVIVLRSTTLAANTALTSVLIGTPVTPALPANSVIISNVTASGDILVAVNKGDHSQAVFWADASTGDTAVMAASGQSVDVYIAGTKEVDYATGAMAFQQATVVSTTTGNLTLSAAAGSSVLIGDGASILDVGVDSKDAVRFNVATTFNVVRFTANSENFYTMDARDTASGTSGHMFDIADITITSGATTHAHIVSLAAVTFNFNGGVSTTLPIDGLSLRISAPIIASNSAVTITQVSTLYVPAPDVSDAEVTATRNLAAEFDGSILLKSSLWAEGAPTEGAAGEQLESAGAATVPVWAAASSLRQYKDVGEALRPQVALDRLLGTKVLNFTYKPDSVMNTADFDTVYAGVMGDDFPEVMHHGGKIFSPVSGFGYTVGAIQAMQAEIEQLRAQVALLETA